MPTSLLSTIEPVLRAVVALQPRSILDVGCGTGKYGVLFREYVEIAAQKDNPRACQRDHWKVQIDAVEAFAPYVTPLHHFIYDEVIIGDICEICADLPTYDAVFLGDVLEHLEKARGRRVLEVLYDKAERGVVVSTPARRYEQCNMFKNKYERHRSFWHPNDFRRYPNVDWMRAGFCRVYVLPKVKLKSRWFGRKPFVKQLGRIALAIRSEMPF